MHSKSLTLKLLAVLALLSAPAFAHGGAPHVMGTVKSVQPESLTVETVKHQEVTVRLSPETRYEKGKTAATLKDVAPGERVVVHTRKDGTALTAIEVHLGTSAGAHEQHAHAEAAHQDGGTGR